MVAWLTAKGLSPHGFCLSWNPALLLTHSLSDAAMGLSYIAIGGVIFWFGRRRPDMGPAVLFWSLAVVFGLCGLTHLSNIATTWVAAYEVQSVVKVVAAVSSVATISVLGYLAPQTLSIPSVAQLKEANNSLTLEREEHRRTGKRLARLATAVEQNPNMIIVTDGDGVIEYVNRAFEAATGYSRTVVIGQKPSLLASGTTARWVYDNMWHSIKGQREWRGELMDRRRDGAELWVATSIAPLLDASGTIDGYVAIQQDITDRKAAEVEMAEARRQAEIANKAKSELLANMSHELRTPLNAVIGFSEVMAAQMFGPLGGTKYVEYSNDILNSARHLLEVINDVLDVSAIEAGKLTLFDERVALAPLVEASVRMVAGRAKQQGLAIVIETVPELEVTVDQRRMKQVLINLLTNAVKFTPAGGEVTVSVRMRDNREVALVVADNGIGMSPEELELALQAFGQVEGALQRRHQGTGLGLPICIGIMERHGGALHLASVKGKGTTATAILPPIRVFVPA